TRMAGVWTAGRDARPTHPRIVHPPGRDRERQRPHGTRLPHQDAQDPRYRRPLACGPIIRPPPTNACALVETGYELALAMAIRICPLPVHELDMSITEGKRDSSIATLRFCCLPAEYACIFAALVNLAGKHRSASSGRPGCASGVCAPVRFSGSHGPGEAPEAGAVELGCAEPE